LPEKHQHFHIDRQFVTKKEVSSKMNILRQQQTLMA